LTKVEIIRRLSQAFVPGQPPESPYPIEFFDTHTHSAAVLIPFLEKENAWHLLFIRRTVIYHDKHSGQVAFPGGRFDPSDLDAESTAIREAHEEIGVNLSDVQILGHLRDMLTITNYRVTPIVGLIPWPYSFVRQIDEVARIFSIPLRWLAQPANREVKMRGVEILGKDVPVIHFQKYDGEILWGASARITLLLLEALGLASPDNRYSQQ
jgi:8-oxo-dGTP pyrophosphatase MutT (NUDIX family)